MAETLLIVGNGSIAVDGKGQHFVHNHNADLVRKMNAFGFEATLISPQIPYDPHLTFHNDIADGETVMTTALVITSALSRVASMLRLGRRILGTNHLYIFYPGTWSRLAALIARLAGKEYGLYFRGQAFSTSGIDGWLIRGARFAVVVSPTLADVVGSLVSRVEVARPMSAVDASDIVRVKTVTPATRPWRLLFVGNLLPTKGIWELLDAAAQLKAKGFWFDLHIVGSGALFNQLMRAIEAQDLSRQVLMTGLISDKAALMKEYESADIFVLPTKSEGFPRVLYEAMAKSVPIVTTMVGGIPGRMTDGENCLAIPAGDSSSIASAVKRLAGDAALRTRIMAGGRSTLIKVLAGHRPHADLLAEALSESGWAHRPIA